MHLDLTDEETSALRSLLTKTIENDRYPLSPRIQTLRGILAKFGQIVPVPPLPARPPTPEERDPSRRPRGRARRRQITGEAGAAPEAVTAGEPPGGRSERTLPTGCCQY